MCSHVGLNLYKKWQKWQKSDLFGTFLEWNQLSINSSTFRALLMDILMKTTPETTSVEVLCQCFFLCICSHPLVIQNCWQTWQVTILSRHTNCTMPGGVYWKVEDSMIFLLNFGCATRVPADLRYRVLSKLGAGAFSTVRTPREKSVVCCVLCPIHRPGKGWEKSWFNLIWCDIMSCYIIYYMTYCWHKILDRPPVPSWDKIRASDLGSSGVAMCRWESLWWPTSCDEGAMDWPWWTLDLTCFGALFGELRGNSMAVPLGKIDQNSIYFVQSRGKVPKEC